MVGELNHLSNIEDRLCDILEELREWRAESRSAVPGTFKGITPKGDVVLDYYSLNACTKMERQLLTRLKEAMTKDITSMKDVFTIVRGGLADIELEKEAAK